MTSRAIVYVVVVLALLFLAAFLMPPDNDAPRYPYLPTPVDAPCTPASQGMWPL